jgi:hypothetical protein
MANVQQSVAQLVEDYRAQCLWFLRPDYMPSTPDEIFQTLALVERYGDRAAYLRAERIKSWLLRDTKPRS